jgi:very-short-patch-repair endonuclease
VCRESDNYWPKIDTPPSTTATPDDTVSALVARIATDQHGVVTRSQLLDAGVKQRVIAHRLRTGALHRLHRGVYTVGYRSTSPLTHAMAAVLACGPQAVLSHRSAAWLWEIDVTWRGPTEVTTTARSARDRDGVTVHRSRTLTQRHVTVRRGIPVTTVARTLVDLADVLDDRSLARALNEAQLKRLVRLDELAALLPQLKGRHAAKRLRPFVQRPDAPTRSVLEDAFLNLVERHALPRPEVNQRLAGYEVDMLWRKQRLVAELDGRRYHEHARAFEHDRDKDATLLAAGYRVVRVTWRRLVDEPKREAERLRALLSR